MGAARIYRTGSPFNAVDLADMDFEQTADVMYFVNWDHDVQKLVRFDHADWRWSTVSFGPTIGPPATVTGFPTTVNDGDGPLGGNSNYWPTQAVYVVTAIGEDGSESRASAAVTVSNDLTLRGNFNTVSWAAVTEAARYNIYKTESGSGSLQGYIGSTTALSFRDQNILPDFSETPPIGENPFAGEGNRPSTITFYQQRMFFGRTKTQPNGIWFSRSGDFENMDRRRPLVADDAGSFALVASRVNAVNQLVPLTHLLALTSDGMFRISDGQQGFLSPTNIVSTRQGNVSSARLPAEVVNEVTFFVPASGNAVMTAGYSFEIDGYRSSDVSIFSSHLFEGFTVRSWCYQRDPFSVLWAVRSDGKLLALTWEQEQQVWGWTLCETAGEIESVCCINEQGEDRVYLAVNRAGLRTIERLASPRWATEADATYLDSAVRVNMPEPVQAVNGLWHLEGQTVDALVDGHPVAGLDVENGTIVLPFAGRKICVGLPYLGLIETLPVNLAIDGTSQTRRQMIAQVKARVFKTRGIEMGASEDAMFELPAVPADEITGLPPLVTDDIGCNVSARWSSAATAIIRQRRPLPMTINSIFVDPVVTS
jgi:hypothetical protein